MKVGTRVAPVWDREDVGTVRETKMVRYSTEHERERPASLVEWEGGLIPLWIHDCHLTRAT